jgi:uncharacterized protein
VDEGRENKRPLGQSRWRHIGLSLKEWSGREDEFRRAMYMTTAVKHAGTTRNAVARVSALDWHGISQDLDGQGNAVLPGLLTPDECQGLAELYPDDALFRSRVVMARHGFGRGEYKYFRYPLPDIIADLRTVLYSRLAPVANRWSVAMGVDVRYPESHDDFIERCRNAGQVLPTPLLLKYGEWD